MDYPAFSKFRSLITRCDEAMAVMKRGDEIASLLGQRDFVFFFKFDGSIYGAPEESRVVFAKMKHPDETVNKEWVRDANFSAVNIDGLHKGEESERVFGTKDVKKIDVIDQDRAMSCLTEKGKKD